MIWRPRRGQRVLAHYNCRIASRMPFHGAPGAVIAAASGPGPINALVAFDDGRRTIVPRGNLTPEPKGNA